MHISFDWWVVIVAIAALTVFIAVIVRTYGLIGEVEHMPGDGIEANTHLAAAIDVHEYVDQEHCDLCWWQWANKFAPEPVFDTERDGGNDAGMPAPDFCAPDRRPLAPEQDGWHFERWEMERELENRAAKAAAAKVWADLESGAWLSMPWVRQYERT